MPTQIITNVPKSNVKAITQGYLNAGASSVTPVPESDGEITLIIVFPDQAALRETIISGTDSMALQRAADAKE